MWWETHRWRSSSNTPPVSRPSLLATLNKWQVWVWAVSFLIALHSEISLVQNQISDWLIVRHFTTVSQLENNPCTCLWFHLLALSQMAHFICTFRLVDLQWLLCQRVRLDHETVGCPICHFRFQKGAHEHPSLRSICALDAHFCRARTGASSTAAF